MNTLLKILKEKLDVLNYELERPLRNRGNKMLIGLMKNKQGRKSK